MRKLKTIILALFVILGGNLAHTCYATEIVGYACYTDIVATINCYSIESYNINGKTAIVAEDLQNYGFDVIWNDEERTLHITRGSRSTVQSVYIAPEISSYQIGKKAYNVYKTDIKTYVGEELVESFNINGRTIIYFDCLSNFGKINWWEESRRIELNIFNLNYKIGEPCFNEEFSIIMDAKMGFEKNSVDGIQVRWLAKNNTNKTINYYTTNYFMYNAVGDPAYDEITGKPYFSIKTVGPVYPGEFLIDYTGKHEAEAYSKLCSEIYLYSINLEYGDGTKETVYYSKIGFEH